MITPKPKTCIHVKTQEEYDSLMKELEESGFIPLSSDKWPNYREKTLIGIENKRNLDYGTSFGFEGYTIEEYLPEFRVGDTVEVSEESPIASLKGYIGKIKQIKSRNYIILYNNYFFHPKYLKLISRAEEPKTVMEDICDKVSKSEVREFEPIEEPKNVSEMLKRGETMQEYYNTMTNAAIDNRYLSLCFPYGKSLADLDELFKDEKEYLNKINKPNKKTFMSTIVDFAKNAKLKATNPDEFALRTAGLKDQKGNWTQEARQIVINFKAEQLGFKNYDDLINEIGYNGEISAFELHALFIEFAADLLNIANEKIASEAKK